MDENDEYFESHCMTPKLAASRKVPLNAIQITPPEPVFVLRIAQEQLQHCASVLPTRNSCSLSAVLRKTAHQVSYSGDNTEEIEINNNNKGKNTNNDISKTKGPH